MIFVLLLNYESITVKCVITENMRTLKLKAFKNNPFLEFLLWPVHLNAYTCTCTSMLKTSM